MCEQTRSEEEIEVDSTTTAKSPVSPPADEDQFTFNVDKVSQEEVVEESAETKRTGMLIEEVVSGLYCEGSVKYKHPGEGGVDLY